MRAGCIRTMMSSKPLSEAPPGITTAIPSPITTLADPCGARREADSIVLRVVAKRRWVFCGEGHDAAHNWMIWARTRSSAAQS